MRKLKYTNRKLVVVATAVALSGLSLPVIGASAGFDGDGVVTDPAIVAMNENIAVDEITEDDIVTPEDVVDEAVAEDENIVDVDESEVEVVDEAESIDDTENVVN